MRKLTVKNFSVIKDAELEFGKITVLIGPQASGKSLLCKLAYFFAQIVPEIVNGLVLRTKSPGELKDIIASQFTERFPSEAWGTAAFEISYESKEYRVSLWRKLSLIGCIVDFNSEFLEQYDRWAELHGGEGSPSDVVQSLSTGTPVVTGPLQIEDSMYIPAGRSFFSTPNRGFASFSGKNLDWITQRFAAEIDWEYRALIEASIPSSDLFPQFVIEAAYILGGKVIREGGILLFQPEGDTRKLPFQLLSSGTLELLPLLNPLGRLVYNISTNPLSVWSPSAPILGPIFVEEPELSVFPKTQYDLIRIFAWLSNEPRLAFSFAITTHSPYILTAFNNLIEAGQVAAAKPELKDEVAKLIPEHFWIKAGDFKAYAIEDGVLTSIVAKDTGLVSSNYLDQVSETIGVEFDELLRLGYVEA